MYPRIPSELVADTVGTTGPSCPAIDLQPHLLQSFLQVPDSINSGMFRADNVISR
jgi:hypothetical protein